MKKIILCVLCMVHSFAVLGMEEPKQNKGERLKSLQEQVQLSSLRTKLLFDNVSPRQLLPAISKHLTTDLMPRRSPRSSGISSLSSVSPRQLLSPGRRANNPYSPRTLSPRTWNSEELLCDIIQYYQARLGQTDNPERVKRLLDNYALKYPKPLILECANASNTVFARWLCAQDRSLLLERDSLGRTALHESISVEFARWILEQLVEEFNSESEKLLGVMQETEVNLVDLQDFSSRTPLFMAALCDYQEIVKYFLEQKANIYGRDAFGGTVLHYGLSSPGILRLILAALEQQFKIDEQDIAKKTVEAYVNQVDKAGQTPLHVLCKTAICSAEDKIEIINMLINSGARVNQKDKKERTPLHIVVKDIRNLLTDRQATAKCLLENGAEVNSKDNKSRTPLHYAIVRKFYPDTHILAYTLILHGASLTIKDAMNNTPMSLAKKLEFSEQIKQTSSLQEYTVNSNVSSLDQKINITMSLAKALDSYRVLYLKNREKEKSKKKIVFKKRDKKSEKN